MEPLRTDAETNLVPGLDLALVDTKHEAHSHESPEKNDNDNDSVSNGNSVTSSHSISDSDTKSSQSQSIESQSTQSQSTEVTSNDSTPISNEKTRPSTAMALPSIFKQNSTRTQRRSQSRYCLSSKSRRGLGSSSGSSSGSNSGSSFYSGFGTAHKKNNRGHLYRVKPEDQIKFAASCWKAIKKMKPSQGGKAISDHLSQVFQKNKPKKKPVEPKVRWEIGTNIQHEFCPSHTVRLPMIVNQQTIQETRVQRGDSRQEGFDGNAPLRLGRRG